MHVQSVNTSLNECRQILNQNGLSDTSLSHDDYWNASHESQEDNHHFDDIILCQSNASEILG